MEQLKIFCERNLFDPSSTVAGFKDAFSKSWSEVYFNNGVEKSDASLKSWLNLITSFLGMPFFNGIVSWESFCKNFFGWDEQKYLLPINIIRACFFGLFNLLFIIPRFILNIVKLATELVPLFLRVMVHGWTNKLISLLSSSSGYHWFTKIFIALPLVILFPLYIVFKLAHIIGRAITSPHKNLYAAWEAGQELAGDGILGKIAGGFFCLIGLALTTLAYLILFPIAIKLIMTYAPTVITSAVQTVLNFLAPLSSFGTALGTVTTPIFQLFGGFFYYIGSPVINGLAGVIGLTVGPFVVLLDKIDEGLAKFSEWWRTPSPWFKDKGPNINPPGDPVDLGGIRKKVQDNVEKVIQNPVKPAANPQPVKRGVADPVNPPQPVKRQQYAHEPAQPPRGQNNRQQNQPPQTKAKKKLIDIPEQNIQFGKELGKGGFGIVRKARWDNKDVAVKQAINITCRGKDEFKREFGFMFKLESDYIVHVYGACISQNMIVMEFMAEGSLDKFLQKRPDWKIRSQIGIDITMGMAYLHGENIIHADFKSLNVLIGANYQAKITDFGLAKQKQNALTVIGPTGGAGGTPLWMAPEQFEDGAKTTKESDAFSYGVVLWELGAMKYPYADLNNIGQVVKYVMGGNRETITPDTPKVMASVITQCWRQNPKERPHLDDRLVAKLQQEFDVKYPRR